MVAGSKSSITQFQKSRRCSLVCASRSGSSCQEATPSCGDSARDKHVVKKTTARLLFSCFTLLFNETVGHWFGRARTCAGLEIGGVAARQTIMVRAG